MIMMALNPSDNTICCFVGKGLFRLVTISDSIWRQYGFQKADNLDFSSVCWLNGDRILAGTMDGRIVIVENGELIAVYNVKTMMDFDPKNRIKAPLDVVPLPKESNQRMDIRCCIPIKIGLIFVFGDSCVYYYEKTNHRYKRRNEFLKQSDSNLNALDSDRPMHNIETLSISPKYQKMICVTRRSQLFWAPLAEIPDTSLNALNIVYFKSLGEDLHHGGISSLSTCKWKPIFITCGKIDHTIRVWNYLNCSLLLSQQYQEDVFSVSLHPSGLYSVAAFTGKVEFQLVHTNGLKAWREFAVTSCNLTEFSTSGHMFALANLFDVDVYCSVKFEKRFTFKGHSNTITAMVWASNDMKLVTCGEDGAIYEFNTRTGERDMDIVHPKTVYMDLAVSNDTNQIFPAAQDGRFKEINNQSVVRDIDLHQGPLDAIALSRSDLILFVAGQNGVVLSLMLPIMAEIKHKEFYMHNKNITKMCMTIDDSNLITCSTDGSICIWKIKDAEGKKVILNDQFAYSDDILVNASDLKNKIENIVELKMRVNELERESKYQITQLIKSKEQQIQELNNNHSIVMKILENKNTEITKKHMADKSRLEMELNLLKDSHAQELEELEANYNKKLLHEYEKYDILQKELIKTNSELEKDMNKSEFEQNEKLQKIVDQYNVRLDEKDENILKLKEQLIKDKQSMTDLMHKVEEDADREVLEKKANFVTKLRELKQINLNLRGELGSYKMKAKAASKEAEDLGGLIEKYEEDIAQLKVSVKNEEQTIIGLKKQIQVRDDIIEQKESRIFEEKLKMKDLEKQLLLAKENISELELTVEPLIMEIQEKQKTIENMESEMLDMTAVVKQMQLRISEQRDKLNACGLELAKKEQTIRDVNRVVKNIQVDIHSASEHYQNFAKLKDVVKDLFIKYGDTKTFGISKDEEHDTRMEFTRQRKFLEQSIIGLKKRVNVCAKKDDSYSKIMEENMILIDTINKLRQELKQNHKKYENLKSILKIKGSKNHTTTKQAKNNNLHKAITNLDTVEKTALGT
ncbi:cilia- and flagella-associated protein 57 [Aphis craccivora]|uniref:Cilia-and flagella-associated protein 57 n=1 Tax=Aphis craccivora TaxID=307492 RepID=A0A6G0YZE4_APHCR|nr:cilia- and flagella-associated protein 57 [Aphis craccivora]